MPFTRRIDFSWELRTRSLLLGARTLVMGVLNVTPDSFSDGGLYHGTRDAVTPLDHAYQLFEAASEPKELWIAEGAHHCGAYFIDRQGYVARVAEFFAQGLA